MNDHSIQPAGFWRAWNNRPDGGVVTQADRDLLRAVVFDFNLNPVESLNRIAKEYPDFLGDMDADALTERACLAAERLFAGKNVVLAGGTGGHMSSPYSRTIQVLIEKLREKELTSDSVARYSDILRATARGIISELYDQFAEKDALAEDLRGGSKRTIVESLLERPDDASVGAFPFLMRHVIDKEWHHKNYDPDYLIPGLRLILGERGHLAIGTESATTSLTRKQNASIAEPRSEVYHDYLVSILHEKGDHLLGLLPEEYRAAIVRYYGLDENPTETKSEIAERIGKSRETVSKWIDQGLSQLHHYMNQELDRDRGEKNR
ncbi:MAG: hypothetical protein EB060_01540 [Proteobacteria bacterium]|nr:hypothetical protein [Pseudomonadota bacterium]